MARTQEQASLVVLGMHRSGTSALAGALGLCGAWLGDEGELTAPNKENPRGFFERRDLRAICDKLLYAAGADWWKVSRFEPISIPHEALAEQSRILRKTLSELDRHGTWVIKEPRLCLLLPALRAEITDPVCIHIHRNPLQVAHSLRVRNGFGVAEGIALWEAYNRRALHASEGLRRVLVSYEDLVADPEGGIARLVQELAGLGVAGLAVPSSGELKDFISPSLQRHRFRGEEAEGFLTEAQLDLWRGLQSGDVLGGAAEDGLGEVARQHLADLESRKYSQLQSARNLALRDDRIKQQDAEVEARAAEVEELRSKLSSLDGKVENLEAGAAGLKEKLERRNGELEALAAELAAANLKLSQLKARSEELKAKLVQREGKLDRRTAELAAANEKISHLKARTEELKGRVADRNGELSAATRNLQALEARAGELEQELAATSAVLPGLRARAEELDGKLARSQRELEQRSAELDQANRSLAGEKERADRHRAEVGERDRKLAASARKVEAMGAQLSELKVALKERELERKVLAQQNATLQAHIAEIHASHSWRVTAPLRSASLATRWFIRNIRRCFMLLGWLATGQFARARTASRPYLERVLPGFAHGLLRGGGADAVPGPAPGAPGRTSVRGKDAGKAPVPAGKSPAGKGNIKGAPPRADVVEPALRKTAFGKLLAEILVDADSKKLTDHVQASEKRLLEIRERAAGGAAGPLVSIIMPTHDRAAIIAGAIATVRQQEYTNWELLVCDDASSDNTEEVVAALGDRRIRYLKLERGGAAAARNAGLRESRGTIIAYLDSDNFWHPGYLVAMVKVLQENPGRSAAYASYIDFHLDADGKRTVREVHFSGFHHERLLAKNYIDLNTFIHRRELYDLFGGFNDKLTRRQDYDLILKYTWLRDPMHLPCLLALYQRNDKLVQITQAHKHDDSCVEIINGSLDGYFRQGLPVASPLPVRKVTILSWDLCRNHFSKAFAIAEALSEDYEVQLVSFRFFEEEIFPPLRGVEPSFETLYLPGGQFPGFFDSVRKAVDAIDGDVIYVVKPRMPSLGIALLANQRRGTPLILEINDLETVVSSPTSEDRHVEQSFASVELSNGELLNPYSDLWSQVMDPIAKQLPVLVTHNHNIDAHFGHRCLYMRNIKDERVYDPSAYDRGQVRAELGFAPGDRVILFGGLLRKHKGIYELVDLVERLADPRYKLLFVGSRVTPDQKRLMEKYGDQVRVLPPQGRESMARINLAADLVILWLDPEVPASAYQMPYKATDALAMETSIIANEISDLGDLGRQGYLRKVPFGDWEKMRAVIADVFDNTKKREARQAAGRRLFLRQFSYASARSTFRLVAARAVETAGQVLPAAAAFAGRFNEFHRAVTGASADLLPAPVGHPAVLPWLGAEGVPEDAFIEAWAVGGLQDKGYRDPHGVAVVMHIRQRDRALAAARLLVKRAGMRTRVIMLEPDSPSGPFPAMGEIAHRVEVRYLVLLSEDAYPGLKWLDAALGRLEGSGKAVLSFNTGAGPGEPGAFALVRRSWLEGFSGGVPPVESGWEAACRGLVDAASRQDALVHEEDCVVIDVSARPTGTLETGLVEPPQEDGSIQIVDVKELDGVLWSDPEGIAVVMPCINPEKGLATARFLRARAGTALRIYVVVDTLRQGFIRTLNRTASALEVKYIVYLAEDAFPGVDWLRIARERLERSEKGLLAFNCGKWRGRIAAFGMVRMDWVRPLYGGAVFFEGYEAHKADNELTVIARVTGQLDYAPDATLAEYDVDKVFVDKVRRDRDLFRERFLGGFEGAAPVDKLLPLAREYFVPLPKPGTPPTVRSAPEGGAPPGGDTFVFYRIIGNDLYPRHQKGQALTNLRFILDHEPALPGCEKRFILNRILDKDQEREIMAALDQHGHPYMRIPFDPDEYRELGFDTDALPEPGFFSSPRFDSFEEVKQERATLAMYRHKNNYVMNNNGARNTALEDGHKRARWILPWDGNCFLTAEAWEQIRRDISRQPGKKYFVVPMARMLSNEPLVHGGEIPAPTEEPQIIFRADAGERFNPEFCYGRRPKVELLWRLGVKGPWDSYLQDAWDQKRLPVSPDVAYVGKAGWVARLFSGMAALESGADHSVLNRGFARSEAILATLRHLDVQLAQADSHSTMSLREHVLGREVEGRNEATLRTPVQALVAAADKALLRGPFTVTDKTTLPPSGDAHDYWHPAPYWWPNPHSEDGLPYIRKDGERVPGTRMYEPDSEKYDRTRLQRVFDDSLALALAWSFTGEQRYAGHGARILERFFVDPATRMNPHLKYGQVRMGHNRNLGAPTGLIEMKDLYYYLDSVRILEGAGVLDAGVLSAFRRWLEEYLEWVLTSDQGCKERAAINNHGTCYDLQVASIASFLGNEEMVYSTLIRSQARIPEQFSADGAQPDELKRTTTAHYCCFNFQSWVNLAELASRWGVDLWAYRARNGAGLAQGARWLLSHMGKPWPYKQIDEFDPERFHPIWFAAREKVDGLAEGSATVKSPYRIKPVYFPHDGIRPFWNLASYGEASLALSSAASDAAGLAGVGAAS